MKFNREEIIKALECCHLKSEDCISCPFVLLGENCANLERDAITLIRELTEENDRLRADVVGQLEAEVYSSDKYIDEYDGSEVQKAYNKGLRDALKIAKELLEENK